MSRRKKTFFERLTGSVDVSDEDNYHGDDPHNDGEPHDEFDDDFHDDPNQAAGAVGDQWQEDQEVEDAGELAVDVYETPEQVVVQAMVAGVRPEALDVSITREMCTISGRREAPREAGPDEYLHEELYWGAFSRSVVLPEEVEVEEAQANESHGLLTIRLPKINKDLKTQLEIQSE